MFFVYIIYSESTDIFYRGQTKNLVERISRHNSGREKFTSKGIPWTLIWHSSKNTRGEALKLEKKLKNLSRAKLIEFIMKYHENIAGPDALILLDQWSGC